MSTVYEPTIKGASRRAVPAVQTLALDEALLNGKTWRANILDVILGGSERRTVEGASELRLDCADPTGELLTSGIFGEGTTVEIDGVLYSFVKYSRSGARRLSLTFEDAHVAKLRTYRKPRKVYRGKVNRSDFARMLVREARTIGFFTINKSKPGKIAAGKPKVVDDEDLPGFAPKEKVRVKGGLATGEQRRNIAAVLDYGYKRNYPRKVLVAAAATIVVESNARNLKKGDRDSQGLFQQRPSQGWGTVKQVRDIEHASGKFYTAALAVYRKTPNISVGDLAQAVQRSGKPREYGIRTPEAERNVTLYLGGKGGSSLAGDKTVKTARYAFSRGKPGGPAGEDTWSALQRLAQEVGWRCFMVGRFVWFLSEIDLFGMRPIATITPESEGVEDVSFDYDVGRPVAEATVTIRLGSWRGGPGSVVNLEGYGPADGRWLVVEMERPLLSITGSVKLRKPDPKLPEPSGETISTPSPSGGTGGSGSEAADGSGTFDGKFRWPTKSHPITSPFGPRNGRTHAGLDIGVVTGTPVAAAAAGKVAFVGVQGGYGNCVTIQHNGKYATHYAHLSSFKCRVGQRVSAGQVIASSGGAAGAPGAGTSTGPHLHFEIRNPSATDPMRFL